MVKPNSGDVFEMVKRIITSLHDMRRVCVQKLKMPTGRANPWADLLPIYAPFHTLK